MKPTHSASIFLETSALLLSSEYAFAQNNTSDDASSYSKNNSLYVLISILTFLVVVSIMIALFCHWLNKRKKQSSVNPLFPSMDIPENNANLDLKHTDKLPESTSPAPSTDSSK